MIEAASSYPLLNLFWTMVIFFAWVIWFWLLITILADVFSRSDISGWAKATWTLFMIVVPFVGVLSYLISQSGDMVERRQAQAQAQQASFDSYVRSVAASPEGQAAAEIERAKQLLDSGAINDAEFQTLKQKALIS
ncbi:MAG TPA: SHOCT domain-containing protein [Frankiaceae bacterium]|nr:SHOCT domain-containing protein [Frankiaceae bacterium]